VTLGYQGIAFIRSGQKRANMLLKVDENTVSARSFMKTAVITIFVVAVPYCAQRIFFETLQRKWALRYLDQAENDLRLKVVLSDLPTVSKQAYTPTNYVSQHRYILENTYWIISRKCFSLPKLALLPSIIFNHPSFCVVSFPVLLGIDYIHGQVMALMTKTIEDLSQNIEKLNSNLLRIEAHDSKHASIIDRAGDMDFVGEQWGKVTRESQVLSLQMTLLMVARRHSKWLYRGDIILTTIQCGIACLLEWKDITAVDIYVYMRGIEDAVDLILMRSRAEAELARIRTNGDRLAELKNAIISAKTQDGMVCSFRDDDRNVISMSLDYSRGNDTKVKIANLQIEEAGVFAVVGPNGCGKSTLFSLLLGCTKDGPLPPGVVLTRLDHMVLPAKDITVISQNIYCPLQVVPQRWVTKRRRDKQRIWNEDLGTKVIELGRGLQLKEEGDSLLQFLTEENDDFCDALSGGEQVKMELIRAVFLLEKCPRILLLDETFSPLDPESKNLVMKKLRNFCQESIILVIYHAGVNNSEQEEEVNIESLCTVKNSGDRFFDGIIDFGDGNVTFSRC